MAKPQRTPLAFPAPDAGIRTKPRDSTPHAFVLEELSDLRPHTRNMFGCVGVYVGDQIVVFLRDKPTHEADNGIWLATSHEHHESLRTEFPGMRSITVLGKDVTGWQILPADAPDFEESALRACELIRARDPRIGKIPARRKGTKAKAQSPQRRQSRRA